MTEKPCGTIGWSAEYPLATYVRTLPETGYDMPCGRWTPALPNPTPAYDAASSMFERASSSDVSSKARTRYWLTIRSACIDQMSLIGFDPWYAGRIAGRSGIGRSVYGIAVNDSTAWLRMSSPVDAAICGGMVRVLSGSRYPSVGLRRRLAMPVFAFNCL